MSAQEARRRLGPPLLIVLMLAAGLALNLPHLLDPRDPLATPRVPLLLLVVGFIAFELVVLHVHLGRDLDHSEEFNLTETMLVVGLVLAEPRDLIVAVTGTAALVNLARRSQTPLKQLFNASSHFFDVAVALTVYELLVPADPLSGAGWGAATAAAVAGGLTSAAVVTVVLLLVVGRIPARDVAGSILSAVPLSVGCAALGFVAVIVLHSGSAATAPLLLATASLLLLVGRTSALTERHLNLVSLHRFGEQVSAAHRPEELAALALQTAADLLMAREMVAYLVQPGEGPAQRFTLGEGRELHTDWVDRAAVPRTLGLLPGKDMLVSSASLADEGDLVLVASGRATALRRFRGEELRVLDMVAHRTGSDLRTRLLIEQLRHDALHDALTGLPNRASLTASAHRHALAGDEVVATWLGLTGLQQVNAALGYDLGDELIVQVGARLTSSCGPGGTVARVGGDEFVVLQPVAPSAQPLDQARTLLASLEQPFSLTLAPVLVRASAGVAVMRPQTSMDGDDLLRQADIAMRTSKSTGRSLEQYHPKMEQATPELLALATELQTGIATGQLVLHGQPQVRLADGVTIGVEMLVRWNHPQRGLLPPIAFLPLAESTGLERPLTDWVLGVATATLAAWREEGLTVTVSVNIPPSSLADTHLLTVMEQLLAQHAIPGDQLVVEVVESGLITNADMAAEVLRGISALGVRVSIDDFGTGFSSLSHLQHLPVDEIKVDKSFVAKMMRSEDDNAIVRSVINMGLSLGLAVVAEGVETVHEYDALRRLGCASAQGYYMARPIPLDELTELLRSGTDTMNATLSAP